MRTSHRDPRPAPRARRTGGAHRGRPRCSWSRRSSSSSRSRSRRGRSSTTRCPASACAGTRTSSRRRSGCRRCGTACSSGTSATLLATLLGTLAALGLWRTRFPGQGVAACRADLADGRAGDHRRRRRLLRLCAPRPDRRLCGPHPRAHDARGAVRRGHRARHARRASTARCCAPRRASAHGR